MYNGTITKENADEDQSDLLVESSNFRKNVKPSKSQKKKLFVKTNIVLMLLIARNFQEKMKTGFLHHSNLKILNPKQMLQRLSITLTQLKVDNKSERLLKEIRQIIYS